MGTIVTAEIYSDINKANPLEKVRLVNIESIRNSLKNILNLRDKDILFDFTNQKIASYLFETISDANSFSLRNHLIQILSKDSRIIPDIKASDVIPDYINSEYIVNIAYTIKNINLRQQTSFRI